MGEVYSRLLLLFVISLLFVLSQQESCKKQLGQLADSQMRFVSCVVENSVPVHICNACMIEYDKMAYIYNTFVNDGNCTAEYFDKDRINLISTTQTFMTSLWEKAYCQDCFNSNNTEIFRDKYDALDSCLNLNKQEKPCVKCLGQYTDLNSFYINLDQHNNGQVCYDMQDAMNRTRLYWSKTLKCCQRSFDVTLFLIVSSIVAVFPFLFYFGIFAYTKSREQNHEVLTEQDAEIRSNPRSRPVTRLPTIIEVPASVTSPETSPPQTKKETIRKNVQNSLTESESDDDYVSQSKKKI